MSLVFKLIFLSFSVFSFIDCAEKTLQWTSVRALPHDRKAFTQGLACSGSYIYESTGLYGLSSVRILSRTNGQAIYHLLLPSTFFGEGIACLAQDMLLQLTWKNQVALLYKREPLKLIKIVPWKGEGWGLCRDEKSLWSTDGSSKITQRKIDSFEAIRTLIVTENGVPVTDLNDLESVGEVLYVYVWRQNRIIRVNKETGQVEGSFYPLSLLTLEERHQLGPEDHPNGITWDPHTETFLITGKRWPWIFEGYLEYK